MAQAWPGCTLPGHRFNGFRAAPTAHVQRFRQTPSGVCRRFCVHATNAIQPPYKETVMSLGTILLIVLILLLIGAIPSWSHSRSWGYMPSGSIGLIVVIVLVLVMTGRL
jgi:hypothetical protein